MSLTGAMRSWLPRAVGGFALLWALEFTPPGDAFTVPWLRYLYLAVWLAAALLLVGNRGVRYAGLLLAGMAFLRVFWPHPMVTGSAQTLLGWFALLVAVTEGRPDERSLLIRVCVSCVYGFTALAKLNPSFLAGDQLVNLTATREHLEALQPLAASSWGVAAAWGTVLVEGWLAVGLWLPRTRVVTAMVGVVLHVVLVIVAMSSLQGMSFLIVLNGLLVVGYLAFFDRGEADRGVLGSEEPVGRRGRSARTRGGGLRGLLGSVRGPFGERRIS